MLYIWCMTSLLPELSPGMIWWLSQWWLPGYRINHVCSVNIYRYRYMDSLCTYRVGWRGWRARGDTAGRNSHGHSSPSQTGHLGLCQPDSSNHSDRLDWLSSVNNTSVLSWKSQLHLGPRESWGDFFSTRWGACRLLKSTPCCEVETVQSQRSGRGPLVPHGWLDTGGAQGCLC